MLTQEQIENNQNRFLKLISEIDIPDADTEGLVNFLLEGDFFTAPASTIYHCGYKGGLCEHSLNVYDNLTRLYQMYRDNLPDYSNSTLMVVGLLHDISKTNYYEVVTFNKKIYDEKGTKKDNYGKYNWFVEEGFKVKDGKDRFLGGTHEMNSFFLVSKYIPLTYEETLAIIHHQAVPSEGEHLRDMSFILNKYPLITLTQMADYLSTFITERIV